MRNLDIALLRTLLEVAATSNMTTAAKRLHMTQGAVSQQVQRLESMLGQPLIERGKAGTRLTAEGLRLLPEAQKLVDLNDSMIAAFMTSAVTGTVRLGVPHDLIGTHLPPILREFHDHFPAVDIILVTGSSTELREALDSGGVDLALIEEIAGNASGETLLIESPVWVGKIGGAVRQKQPLPISLVSATCVFRAPMIAALTAADIPWRNAIDYPSMEATIAMVQSDLAITLLLPSTIADHGGCLAQLAELPLLPAISITMHFSGRGMSAGCKALAEAIRKSYRARLNVGLAVS